MFHGFLPRCSIKYSLPLLYPSISQWDARSIQHVVVASKVRLRWFTSQYYMVLRYYKLASSVSPRDWLRVQLYSLRSRCNDVPQSEAPLSHEYIKFSLRVAIIHPGGDYIIFGMYYQPPIWYDLLIGFTLPIISDINDLRRHKVGSQLSEEAMNIIRPISLILASFTIFILYLRRIKIKYTRFVHQVNKDVQCR